MFRLTGYPQNLWISLWTKLGKAQRMPENTPSTLNRTFFDQLLIIYINQSVTVNL